MNKWMLLGVLSVLDGTTAAAELRLNRYFTDNMVLQREKPNVIRDLLASGIVGKADLPTVEKLGAEAERMQASIEADVGRLEGLIAEGRFH